MIVIPKASLVCILGGVIVIPKASLVCISGGDSNMVMAIIAPIMNETMIVIICSLLSKLIRVPVTVLVLILVVDLFCYGVITI